MTTITIEIENCKSCPHFSTADQWSSDGWDSMEDWVCKKAGMKIQGSVEWHEEKKVPVPSWCPCRTSSKGIDAVDFVESTLRKAVAEEMLRNARPKHKNS